MTMLSSQTSTTVHDLNMSPQQFSFFSETYRNQNGCTEMMRCEKLSGETKYVNTVILIILVTLT